jgi:hypothetical protein
MESSQTTVPPAKGMILDCQIEGGPLPAAINGGPAGSSNPQPISTPAQAAAPVATRRVNIKLPAEGGGGFWEERDGDLVLVVAFMALQSGPFL